MLSYRVEGEGPLLLLIHGFGISFNIWRQLGPLLRPHFRLVMIELPGIGGSALPDEDQSYLEASVQGIEELRQALGTQTWAVLGYSSGSRIAEAYVSAHAEHVSRAIFLCPVTIDRHKRGSLALGLWLDQRLPAVGAWILSGWRLQFLISWLGFNLRRDPHSADWYPQISAAPLRVLKETIRLAAARGGRGFSVPVPYAMIWGDRDLVPSAPRVPGEHDYFVHGRHAAPVEAPAEIAAILDRFLKESGEGEVKSGPDAG